MTTLAMVMALLASSWANLRAVEDASQTLYRGQGEPLVRAVREFLPRFSGPPPASALEVLLGTQEAAGLRYIALLRRDETLVVEAGERVSDPEQARQHEDRQPSMVVDLGPRILMRSDRWAEPTVVIEFEPLIVNRLSDRATRSLVLSGLIGLVLLAASGMFWRLLKKQEDAERHQEHERRLQALAKMSAVMAHEIRNPLASLKGNAQVLAERLPEGGRDRRKAERLVIESKRLEALCQALLDFCRTRPLDLQQVNPVALVHEVADDLEGGHSSLMVRGGLLEGDRVSSGFFKMEVGSAPKRWPLDALRMRQVLRNLIGNARHASPPDQPVRIRIAREGGRLEISIRDYGEGLPAGEEEQIFEPFFTKRTRGTGLGLSVARRVVELHGGTLSASNADGGGAEFRISIPEVSSWPESL